MGEVVVVVVGGEEEEREGMALACECAMAACLPFELDMWLCNSTGSHYSLLIRRSEVLLEPL